MIARFAVVAAGLAPLMFAAGAWAVPEYSTFELQARSNIVDGYNLPPNSSFNSGTISINDAGDVAFRLIAIGGTDLGGLWVGRGGTGEIVYTAPSGPLVSDPSIGATGAAVFELFDFGGAYGLYLYDPDSGDTTVALPPGGPFAHKFMASPQLAADGSIGFRGKDGASRQGFYALIDGVEYRYVAEKSIDPASPYAFLFTPSYNDAQQIAGKARVGNTGGSAPDEIRIWESNGSSQFIVVDDDGDPGSPYEGFDNSVSLTNDGRVAFIADLGSERGVFLSDGATTVEIATTLHPLVNDISFFSPAANDDGLVAFRGTDASGLDAVFVGDGTDLVRVVAEHDLIPTDLGEGRIDQHDGSVCFGGGVAINDRGDIGFMASLTPSGNNQVEWGSGMFIAYATVDMPGDLDGDGDVDLADLGILLASYGIDDGGDLDGDGDTDLADLGILLANYGN
jgi:hypothetical protein